MRKRITLSFKEEVFKRLETERKEKKLSQYLNDLFEELFELNLSNRIVRR